MKRILLLLCVACTHFPVGVAPAEDPDGEDSIVAIWSSHASSLMRRSPTRDLTPERQRTPTARGDAIEAPCSVGESRWVRVPCSSWGDSWDEVYNQYGDQLCARCLVNVCDDIASGENPEQLIELPSCSTLRERERERRLRGQ